MKQFPKQFFLRIENDGEDDYILISDQLPVPGPGESTKVGRYRLEEIVYSSTQTVKAA
jgi:hypothetical protein